MPHTRETVAARLREAWDTLRRVPAQSVPVLRSHWPQAIQDVADAYGYTPATVRLSPASPQAIDRMMETFTWFRALENAPHLTRAVWLTAAAGMGPRRAAHLLGIHRDTVRARRNEALDCMAEWVRQNENRC
jgi:DNA-directed RNA polymerase specialized sigma24 family protein